MMFNVISNVFLRGVEVRRGMDFTGARRATVASLGVLALAPIYAESPPQKPLAIADAVGIRSFDPLHPLAAFSPDSELVAYTACDPRKARTRSSAAPPRDARRVTGGCAITVTPAGGGTPVTVTHEGGAWAPTWSPDGKTLAFYGDDGESVHVWLWDRSTRTTRRVSPAPVDVAIGNEEPVWTPDGRAIISKVPAGETPKAPAAAPQPRVTPMPWAASGAKGSTVSMVQSGAGAPVEVQVATLYTIVDLAAVDVATGDVVRFPVGGRVATYWISPDGQWIAFTKFSQLIKGARSYKWSLEAIRLETRQPRTLVPAIEQYHAESVQWAPDSRSLAYFSGGSQEAGASCFVITLGESTPRQLTGASDFGTMGGYEPVWDATSAVVYAIDSHTLWRGDVRTGRFTAIGTWPTRDLIRIVPSALAPVAWSPDSGASLYVTARDRATRRVDLLRISLASGELTVLDADGLSLGERRGFPIVSPDDSAIAYAGQSAQRPHDLWLADATLTNRRRLTTLNPELEAYRLGASRLIEYRSVTGAPLKAALLLPAGYAEGRRYPLVAWVYGGDVGSDRVHEFGLARGATFNMQMLSTRGYAVLYPDIPLERGTPVKSYMDTVMPAIDQAVALGIADPDRLGVMGQSAGGYGTLALVTQTTRFKGAVMCAGFGDLASFYGHGWAEWLESGDGSLGGPPWQMPQNYVKNSPIFFLDRIRTPMLIQGTDMDPAVGEFPKQIFTALQRIDKDATYLRYRGEGHVLSIYANQQDFWNRIVAFFDHYVKGTPLQ